MKGEEGRETLIIMTRKNAIKKNKEKGKTDPIWEANEIQIQNRPLHSVCCKAAALGAAFTCQDAVPLGPLETPLLLCGRVSVTLEHPGLRPALGPLIRQPLQTDQEVRLPRRCTHRITSGLPDLIIPPALFCLSCLFQAISPLAPHSF